MPRDAKAGPAEEIEQKIKGVIARYSMLPPGCAVVAGFSGGADSAALTHFLFTHREEYGIRVAAAHVNHCLRETADRDEEAARRFCAERGIPFFVRRADVAALARREGLCAEDCGRRVRYAFFRELAGDGNARIATAHTASDNAETMLMNLVRGAGTHGLSGIPPVRGSIIRPLLGLTRAETEAYCAHYRLPFVQDETNFEEDYARNRVRLGAVPVLRTLNPALENAMLRAADLLREDDALLTAQAAEALARARRGGGWELAALRALPRKRRGDAGGRPARRRNRRRGRNTNPRKGQYSFCAAARRRDFRLLRPCKPRRDGSSRRKNAPDSPADGARSRKSTEIL